ncbi:sulfite oxidase heme-binding subunit YedZ [Thiothrix eikelboomii]|uniref:Protein-methionine-sulfoxide reductase heme-binding subunit MsrQ n=1 Tax=Thiothrix eikelboomii TaxID=92487 RepID=A0A1T4X3L3_9GAMM|nr:protein-methionine-sulfoxide reductase heme-binding subunit MsrQ [Thiothrix eikelboomii]SKA84204.1 sulfoxide reductase heme-binding subunit YedZ [Thiothrix eikelboomii]
MQLPEPLFSRCIKPLVFALALLPLVLMGFGVWQDRLGANPIEAVTRSSGDWALRFLLLTLALSSLRRLIGWTQGIRLRRMLGLFAFFYASIHLLLYLWLDQFFDWQGIWRDILKRPFITVGMLAFLMLLPLAITSPKAMLRRLGKRWKTLHTLIYPLSILAVLHFWWMKDAKSDTSEPLIYALILAALLGERLYQRFKA